MNFASYELCKIWTLQVLNFASSELYQFWTLSVLNVASSEHNFPSSKLLRSELCQFLTCSKYTMSKLFQFEFAQPQLEIGPRTFSFRRPFCVGTAILLLSWARLRRVNRIQNNGVGKVVSDFSEVISTPLNYGCCRGGLLSARTCKLPGRTCGV
jgi:hypothetical protein